MAVGRGGDIVGAVIKHEMPRSRRAMRAVVAFGALALTFSAALLAAPAQADVPEGWSDPDEVDRLHALLYLGGIPILLFLVIVVAVYVPAMIRGERLLPDHTGAEAQWLGGPDQAATQLPAHEAAKSPTGRASGSW